MTTDTKIPLQKLHFTVDQYHRMGETGIIPADARVELINGEIIKMSPINSLHAGTVKNLNRLFSKLLHNDFIVSIQDPVELNKLSEPEPDLAILKFREDIYTQNNPKPSDVLLIVEVADSSLENDRSVKLPLYAQAGIPETWIVNLQDQQIEVSTEPSEKGYANVHIYRPGDKIEHPLLNIAIVVNDVFV